MEEKFVDQADSIQPGWYVCFLHYFSLSYRSFLFSDLRRLEDLGNELVELRKKDRQMRQMMDEKVALGFVG